MFNKLFSSMLRRSTGAAALALALWSAPGCNAEAAPGDAPSAAAQPQAGSATATAALPKRDPVVARRLVEEERALFLDVRTRGEFASGALPGAINIPVEELGGRLDEVARLYGQDKARPVVVYCRSGRRSGIAQAELERAGYDRVVNLGGLGEWQ